MLKNVLKRFILTLIILSMALTSGCSLEGYEEEHGKFENSGMLTVHFIDVGQADSILIKAPSGKNMLIDAGNNGDDETVISYLKSQGVSSIDVLIGTHPHEDHIGAMDRVIENFDIKKVYMPKVTASTKTYKDVISAMKSKNMTVNVAKYGIKPDLGSGVDAVMLSPMDQKYDDLNNYSAVIKLTYGSVSFLFMGDAEKMIEDEMIDRGMDLRANVLKVGHHGSDTSTGAEFLNAVNPKYAVISVGAGNDYNHPHKSTLDKFNKKGVKVLRTDEKGTIVFSTDGQSIDVKTSGINR